MEPPISSVRNDAASDAANDSREDGLAPGARLRAAREASSLSLEDAARALNLQPTVLRALEAGDYTSLDAPVFVKGYLRSYATLLGLDARPLIEAWQRSDPASQKLPDMIRVRERPMVGRPARLHLLPLLALAVLGLLAFALRDLVPVTVGDDPPATARQLGESLPALVMPPPPVAVVPVTPGPPAGDSEVASEPLAPVETPVTARARESDDASRLVLRFAAPSWVEVSDRGGRLLYGEQPAGSRRELRGQPPFQLVLGNAPAVEIEIDGEPFPLAEQEVRGNVLRLAIGDGQ